MMRFLSMLAFATALATVAGASAQRLPGDPESAPLAEPPGMDRIRIDEKLDTTIPTDLNFRNHEGRAVRLSDYFGERPVLLTFAYHTCPTLCSMVLDAAQNGIHEIDWTPGTEYEFVSISIDHRDTPEDAARKRSELLERLGRPGAERGFHFLVGDESTIERITDAFGYRFFYHAAQDQYAHPAALMFLTPEAKIARYLYGLSFNPSDISLSLLEASEGRSISTVEQLLLYCYAYDPAQNGYAMIAMRVMRIGGAVTMLLLGGFLTLLWKRERMRDSRNGTAMPVAVPADQVGTP